MYTVSQGKHSKSSPGLSPTAATSQSSCDFPCGAGCTRGAPGSQMRTKITCFLLLIPSPLRKAMCLLFFFLTTLMKLPGALYSIKPNARSESTREFLMGSRALPCLLSSRPTVHADSALLLKSNRLPGLTRPEAPLSPSFPRSQSHVSPGTCSIRAAAQATHAGRHTHSSLSVPRSLGTSPQQSRAEPVLSPPPQCRHRALLLRALLSASTHQQALPKR